MATCNIKRSQVFVSLTNQDSVAIVNNMAREKRFLYFLFNGEIRMTSSSWFELAKSKTGFKESDLINE